ncbi:hypothetical protein HY251_06390, partial [bacterium]|nr:hypothetical protein [bacterium]
MAPSSRARLAVLVSLALVAFGCVTPAHPRTPEQQREVDDSAARTRAKGSPVRFVELDEEVVLSVGTCFVYEWEFRPSDPAASPILIATRETVTSMAGRAITLSVEFHAGERSTVGQMSLDPER